MESRTTVRQADIESGLRGLGLQEGDIVGVHSSLSRFGYVEGGADAVIDALLAVVGRSGSVVMPAYSGNVERMELTPEEKALGATWKTRILPYHPETDAAWTGKITDTFWRRPGARRGDNPTHSLAAIGPHAEELVQGWHKLLALDGKICLMGVTLANCSSMHLAEEGITLPEYIREKITLPEALRRKYPGGEWEIGFGPYPDFMLMEGPCQARGIMQLARIGDSIVRLARLRELIALYHEYLAEWPEIFYHGCVDNG
jgi:aminoglycoside N3'-acetyltransferase